MTKVLITNCHPTGGGGHVTYIEMLIQISRHSGHIFGVATPKTSLIYEKLKKIEYPYLFTCDFPSRIQKEPIGVFSNLFGFRKIVKTFQPDIIHTNGSPDLFITLWSHLFKRNFKIIRTHHAMKNIGDDVYHKWIYNKCIEENIYVSNSAFSISTASKLKPKKHEVIENGVDLNKYSPRPKDVDILRKYNIEAGTFIFGSCAGIADYKRVDIMIKAASKLKSIKQPYKILVLGEEKFEKTLTNLAKSLGVTEFIYCGFQENVIPYISVFDVGFILSDSVETISFASREMMALEKPILSSSFSGLSENVINGVTGFLVKPGDVDEVTKAMDTFLNMSHEELNQMGKAARKFAISNFDITKQIQSHISIYDRIGSEIDKSKT